MNSDATITTDDIRFARSRVRNETTAGLMKVMSETEPELFGFITISVQAMAGRLALRCINNEIIHDTADEMLELTLTSLIAHRVSYERLWSDADPGSAGDATDSH